MTEPTAPPADGVTPDAPPAAAPEVKTPTVEDIEKLTTALEKERSLRKTRDNELNEFRAQQKAAMTEAERIAAEAEERGAMRVRTEYGQRLAQTEFRAAAAARNPGYDVGKALKYVNLSGLPNTEISGEDRPILAVAGFVRFISLFCGPRFRLDIPVVVPQ